MSCYHVALACVSDSHGPFIGAELAYDGCHAAESQARCVLHTAEGWFLRRGSYAWAELYFQWQTWIFLTAIITVHVIMLCV